MRTTRSRFLGLIGPYYRALSYVWHLLIWSRISAGRIGLLPIELPLEMLARKGVDAPPPRLEITGPSQAQTFSRGFAEIYALLFANLQRADLLSRYRHAIPGPAFRGVYLWDSAFIARIWKWWDPRVAQEVLLAVVELRDGDRLQHVVTELAASRFTQPPLVAWSAVALAQGMEDVGARAFFEQIYAPLCRYQRWLERERRLANGLYAWAHPYESGVENSPRFSNRDESALRDTRTMAAPDFNAYVVLQLDALSTMADRLGRAQEARAFAEEAQALRERINVLLWHEEDGLYYDLDAAGLAVRISTIASLMPLWAGVPDTPRAERLIARILDPAHYGTLIPFPSVDRAEQIFEKDMWRGPVWVCTAYAVIQGLLRYGYEREAGALAWRLCGGVFGVFDGEHRIYEFYDPDALHTRDLHRKRGNWWKGLTLGRGPQRDFVGWSGLVNTLLIEVLIGLSVERELAMLRPRLPAEAVGMRFALTLSRWRTRLVLSCLAEGRCEGVWEHAGRTRTFAAGPDESIQLGPLRI